MNARQAALKILNRCFADGAWSTQTINSTVERMPDVDKSLATKLSLGVMQNYILLDYVIDSYAKIVDLPLRNILRIGAYQILFLDKIPDRASINESVELTKTSGFKSASGLVNAVLRKISSDGIPNIDDLSVKYSHPKWFVDKMVSEHGIAFTENLLSANNQEPAIDYHNGINGEKYVQDNAAYSAVVMLGPRSGMRVLDACASPGGKSFTSAVLMENRGSIISCDIHEKKLKRITDGAERLGISIITARCLDASLYYPEFDSYFDAVIADVPCSGLGVIRKKPDIRFKSYDEISALPDIQKQILSNLFRYVKPGGRLLYSTCTILREENEEVTKNYNVVSEKTFYPHIDGTDGFYAAVIQK